MSQETYLITGSNRGLGLEFVRQISSSPQAHILACVRTLSGDLDDLRSLAKSNNNIKILECNTSSISSIKKCGEEVKPLLEGKQLTYLINNAGINSNPGRTALDVLPEEIMTHIEVNVVGPAEVVKAMEPYLGKGSVVLNMTSGLGSIGKGMFKHTAYAVSKGALNMLTAHQADELTGRGVRVIVMDPGWVKTRMGGSEAMIEAKESVGGMLKVLKKDGLEDTGSFYQYDGEIVPW